MACNSSASLKSGNTNQDFPLGTNQRRRKKRTDSSDTSLISQYSAASSKPSAATSWSSHEQPIPGTPSSRADPRSHTHQAQYMQFDTANGGGLHPHRGTDPHLLHIGAQFYDVLDERRMVVIGQTGWNADPRYQPQPHSMACDLSPMDRYRQETRNDGPYTYVGQTGGPFGVEAAVDNIMLSDASWTSVKRG